VKREIVSTTSAPSPIGPYSQAVIAGDLVFVAGQIALDPDTGTLVDGGTAAEAPRVLANLAAILAAAGCSMADVVKTTVYLVDLTDGPTITAAYTKAFPAPYPARATVQVSALPAGARIEIDAIAHRPPR